MREIYNLVTKNNTNLISQGRNLSIYQEYLWKVFSTCTVTWGRVNDRRVDSCFLSETNGRSGRFISRLLKVRMDARISNNGLEVVVQHEPGFGPSWLYMPPTGVIRPLWLRPSPGCALSAPPQQDTLLCGFPLGLQHHVAPRHLLSMKPHVPGAANLKVGVILRLSVQPGFRPIWEEVAVGCLGLLCAPAFLGSRE